MTFPLLFLIIPPHFTWPTGIQAFPQAQSLASCSVSIILNFGRPGPRGEADVPRKQRVCPVWEAGSTCRCSQAVALFSLSPVPLDGHSHAVCPLGPFKTLSDSADGLAQQWRYSRWSVTAPDCQSFEPPGGLHVGRSNCFLASPSTLAALPPPSHSPGFEDIPGAGSSEVKGDWKVSTGFTSVLPKPGGVLKLTLLLVPSWLSPNLHC